MSLLTGLRERGFQVAAHHHAAAILRHDMSEALEELEAALLNINIPVEELVRGGGGESDVTQRLRHTLANEKGWEKHNFTVEKIVDEVRRESVSHEIDHVRRLPTGTVVLEIEWNNKDPFFDRDLENFKRLHSDSVVSVGVIVTRGETLQNSLRELIAQFAVSRGIETLEQLADLYQPTSRQRSLIASAVESRGSFAHAWAHVFVQDKFGESTTHWRKLEQRVARGVGSPCPLLMIGIPREVVTA